MHKHNLSREIHQDGSLENSNAQWRRSRGGPGVLTPPLFVSVGVHIHMDPPTFLYSKVHFFIENAR